MADRQPEPGHDTVTHVITAWLEGEQWRYQVQHVRSGEERFFTRLEEVAALLADRSGVSPLMSQQEGSERDEAAES